MQLQRLACHFQSASFKAQGGAALPEPFLEHTHVCVCVSVRTCVRECVHGPLITSSWLPDQNPRELTTAHECPAVANHSIEPT